MNIKEYTIISALPGHNIIGLVNEAIQHGRIPVGGICIGNIDGEYYQTMVRFGD